MVRSENGEYVGVSLPWNFHAPRKPRDPPPPGLISALRESVDRGIGETSRRVLIVKEDSVARYTFPSDHPMVPMRCAITHDLLRTAGVLERVDVLDTQKFGMPEYLKLTEHCPEYLANFAQSGTMTFSIDVGLADATSANGDTPVDEHPGALSYALAISQASILAAHALVSGDYDVVTNWSGGMHHGCTSSMAGFCYLNDISEAISVLLGEGSPFKRVLYVDIDVHHGDGVEVMSGWNPNVTTLSIHHFDGGFFPQSGWRILDGDGVTSGIRVNVPLAKGIEDARYNYIAKRVLGRLVDWRKPDVIVLQSGGDSLAQDPLGPFSLSIRGHSAMLQHVLEVGLPVLMVGGGGYNIRNVPRAWAVETALAAGVKLRNWAQCYGELRQVFKAAIPGVRSWTSEDPRVGMTERLSDSNTLTYIDRLIEYLDRRIRHVVALQLELALPRLNRDKNTS